MGKPIPLARQKRALFLDHLAATCHVAMSAEAAGVKKATIYWMRRHDPHFAEEWHEALLQGYQLLETALVAHALGGGARQIETEAGILHVEDGLRILTRHRTHMTVGFRGGPKPRVATQEQTDKSILEKLKVIERRRRDAARPS